MDRRTPLDECWKDQWNWNGPIELEFAGEKKLFFNNFPFAHQSQIGTEGEEQRGPNKIAQDRIA